jgi:malonyl-CoA O-methyltransferase
VALRLRTGGHKFMPLPVQVNGRNGATMSSENRNRHSNTVGYDRWSPFYDQYPNSTVAIDELTFPSLWSDLRDKTVLEIGCGTGRHTQKLAAMNNHVLAIDLSPGMLEVAKKKLIHSDVKFVEADFMTYSGLSSGAFDAALTSLVMEHIMELDAFFLKVGLVLKPNAHFYVSEIHPSRAAKGSLAHFRDEQANEEVHLQSFIHSESQIQNSAKKAGFKLVSKQDVFGDETLAGMRQSWSKYLGMPMIQLWHFQKIT